VRITQDRVACHIRGLRGDGGSELGKAIESAVGVAYERYQAGLVHAIEHLANAR